MGDHRAALIKMELPEYEESYGGTSYTICRAIRFVGYVVVLVLLSYSLWRIHVIESTLVDSDRFANVSKIIALGNSNILHRRVARSIKGTNNLIDPNAFEFEKEMARGGMLTSKNETPLPPKKKLRSKEDFNSLVNELFDAIQRMHNDTERSHFDRNMKAVFQAWFPVFDALLPTDLTENNTEETRNTRSVGKSSEESSGENKNKLRIARDVDKSSDESSEEKKDKQRITRDADKSSEESSEEKKDKQDKSRQVRSLMSASDESSEEQTLGENKQKDVTTEAPKKETEKKVENKGERKSSEESSEENNKNRRKRSFDNDSGESAESDSSESHESEKMSQSNAVLDKYNRIHHFDKGYLLVGRRHEQISSESSESLESSEESFMKKKYKNRYDPGFYKIGYRFVTGRPYYVKNDISHN
ncbi:hypothetical protein TSAR_011950 [Trichomalopsis sarcophagae]|uniref:Uncharacterized protein n=1 Tax=Trichomalopsis sarcophagae TaxID=543379 RepID=A0A232F7E3_9HYME|nr:hypothetical protein TSAR_011950 [Trichomalopsis sarcophagae]